MSHLFWLVINIGRGSNQVGFEEGCSKNYPLQRTLLRHQNGLFVLVYVCTYQACTVHGCSNNQACTYSTQVCRQPSVFCTQVFSQPSVYCTQVFR